MGNPDHSRCLRGGSRDKSLGANGKGTPYLFHDEGTPYFFSPFLYDDVIESPFEDTVVSSVQPSGSEFTISQTLTAQLKLSNHKKKFLKASSN